MFWQGQNRKSRVLQGNRIGQIVAIDQRALFAQSSLNFGNEGISLVSIPRGRNPAGLTRGERRAMTRSDAPAI
jgi:hypothetical protein